jgi:hypothetical protein
MNTRDHHVARRAPASKRPSQAFRHYDGRACDWRDERPARNQARHPRTLRQRFILWRAVRRERRAFRKAYRAYRGRVIPMAELGNRLIDSWLVLIPLGLMCLWAVLYSAGFFK